MMKRRTIVFGAVGAILAGTVFSVGDAAAQASGGPCILDFVGNPAPQIVRVRQPSGGFHTFISGRFTGVCRGQNVTLMADSAEHYEDENLVHLIGRVKYNEPRAKIDSDRATYRTDIGYLHAEGNVYAVTESGNTLRGPVADYYRAVEGVRTVPEMVATGRPLVGLVQRDTARQAGRDTTVAPDTIYVLADRIRSLSDSLVYAGGDVHITRPDLIATGDSVFLDNESGRAQLMINPRVDGRRTARPFTLTGGLIDLFATNQDVERIVASPNGSIVSQDLTLTADSIDMRVSNNELTRTMAWGVSGARAISPDQTITADSIDTHLYKQQVHEIRAIRNAYATSVPDTAIIVSEERDWLQGDSILAVFDTVTPRPVPDTVSSDTLPPQQAVQQPGVGALGTALGTALDSAMMVTGRDSTPQKSSESPPLKSLTAISSARAYYHMQSQSRDKRRPGINYVTGNIIEVHFVDKAVDDVTVIDQAVGVYLEPVEDTLRIAPDSVGMPDSLAPQQSQPSVPPSAPAPPPAPSPAPSPALPPSTVPMPAPKVQSNKEML